MPATETTLSDNGEGDCTLHSFQPALVKSTPWKKNEVKGQRCESCFLANCFGKESVKPIFASGSCHYKVVKRGVASLVLRSACVKIVCSLY